MYSHLITLHLLLLHVLLLLLLAKRRILVLVRLVAHWVARVCGRLGIVRGHICAQRGVHAQLKALECEERTSGLCVTIDKYK